MIQLYTTDELLDELFARFDHAIFAGMKVRPLRDGEVDTPDGQIYERKKVQGNTRVCQGLAFAVQLMKQAESDANSNAVEDDSPSST